jgi:alanyl-tRNA synthetase
MLGNFSFGDYFKKDAIAYAWELITSPEWFGIPRDKLYVTIFNGEGGVPRDAEAYDLWLAQGVAKNRVYEFGLKDNFWQMGDTGPCGPCSEIHYDMGSAASDQGHADCAFGCDCGRYVEIWNLVFMQFDRDSTGKLNPLPKPSIDTGAGLERLAAVMLNLEDPTKISNYETDLFVPLIERAAELTGSLKSSIEYIQEHSPDKAAASLRVIADHSRAATFLISDGVLPSNEGRGYVLRKILRRAISHGRQLGQNRPFLFEMVFKVRDLLQDAYLELNETIQHVSNVVRNEEVRFARTLDVGFEQLKEQIQNELVKQTTLSEEVPGVETTTIDVSGPPKFPGDKAFRLYETFGLPRDFIEDACRDAGMKFDTEGFEAAFAEERARARASWKGATKQTATPAYQQLPKSVFEGYLQTRSEDCEVLAIIKNGQGVQELKPGEEGEVILDHTPFYAESGGQVGDRGVLYSDELNAVVAEVKGTYYPVQGVRAHQVVVKSAPISRTESKSPPYEHRVGWGTLKVGDRVDAVVDTGFREATMRNHTATHLLHAGLREVLGKHVKQAGSLVAPNHLRFDFSHFTAVEDEELQDIEDLINKEVLRNEKVDVIENVPIDVAVNEYHAMALFGEKYGDRVRVIKIGDFSTELCGGTHTGATGEIGLIKILKEGSVSSGVRRVEAITGEGSLKHFRRDHELENVVSKFVSPTLAQKTRKDGAPSSEETSKSKTPPSPEGEARHPRTPTPGVPGTPEWGTHEYSPAEALKAEFEKKDAEIKRLARELDQARMKQASSSTANIGEKIKDVHGVKVLAHRVDNLERHQMRALIDQLRDKIGGQPSIVIVGSVTGNRAYVNVSATMTSVTASSVIKPIAEKIGGKGGGRPDFAEAGGKDPAALDSALGEAYGVVEKLLG